MVFSTGILPSLEKGWVSEYLKLETDRMLREDLFNESRPTVSPGGTEDISGEWG